MELFAVGQGLRRDRSQLLLGDWCQLVLNSDPGMGALSGRDLFRGADSLEKELPAFLCSGTLDNNRHFREPVVKWSFKKDKERFSSHLPRNLIAANGTNGFPYSAVRVPQSATSPVPACPWVS